MPLSRKYTSRVVVATGDISQKFACDKLYPFVRSLKKDEFWDALIEQIVVRNEELILIPKVGNFKIIFGIQGSQFKIPQTDCLCKKVNNRINKAVYVKERERERENRSVNLKSFQLWV